MLAHRSYGRITVVPVDVKTAISLDSHLLSEADRTARAMGLSRSRLFSLALDAYLRNRRQEGSSRAKMGLAIRRDF